MTDYHHIDITEVLQLAAACVRNCDDVRQLANSLDEEDIGPSLNPHLRYDGKRVLVFAGQAASQIAMAAGGLGFMLPLVSSLALAMDKSRSILFH